MPTVSPNEWNTGSTLNTLSWRPKSMRAAACAAFASMLRWDSTTPFGVPSEPEVNRIAAQSSGLRCDQRLLAVRAGRAACRPSVMVGADVFEIDDLDRRARASATSASSLPFSMKAREVTMVSTCAALQAARMLAAPAVKLIIAGTRPADISAEHASPPRRWRSAASRRSARPSGASGISLRPRIARAEQQPLVGERAGDRILDRDALHAVHRRAASISASNTVRSVEVVRNTRSDMIS